ncbi:carboxypeptidase regulatory-like domain-containing protein [Modicisalibacter tunisiensis]|uniref:Carboxypeptidase regulatory-like domain-containing protein n=1 Tax=Modicisalibacter tunisiensis TaxID=390637 RepID=A0ABS7WZK8_9GAMM|nr:carboxypeptidase regulatory-like domain-containing protein [Modicisalibacter tunisiensis]MBZ9567599.1 carboxypeptidase regulatory-like domain-containing protein [Modicisalibacter tunisiensis]
MRRWTGVVALLGLALAGCQGVQELFPGREGGPPTVIDRSGGAASSGMVERKVAFPADTYARLAKHGSATIKGRLTYTTPQGRTLIGAGETVSIAPATPYSAEAAEVALAGKRIEPADPRARAYTHHATTDARGYFVAHDIPAGVFYVAGSVRLPGGHSRSPLILRQVEIGKGQTRQVDLSR